MIACRVCGEQKPASEFSVRRESGRRRSECNACRSKASAALRYGIAVEEIQKLDEAQHGCCAICGTHKSQIPHAAFKHNPLVIDHDHETGTVRGLLCPTCNAGLGHFKDNPTLLFKAAAYLT